MNLKEINEFRAAHGLSPMQGDRRKAQKAKQRAANMAAREQKNRDIRAARNSNKK